MGFGEFDGAKMVDIIGSLPRFKTRRRKAKEPKGELA
jgi:hypothetical protein